jgi:hypothetical protein
MLVANTVGIAPIWIEDQILEQVSCRNSVDVSRCEY